jgi:hypothetical protein
MVVGRGRGVNGFPLCDFHTSGRGGRDFDFGRQGRYGPGRTDTDVIVAPAVVPIYISRAMSCSYCSRGFRRSRWSHGHSRGLDCSRCGRRCCRGRHAGRTPLPRHPYARRRRRFRCLVSDYHHDLGLFALVRFNVSQAESYPKSRLCFLLQTHLRTRTSGQR